MILRKIFGIIVFCVQAVVATDFYFQTRDAGLKWGELSSAQYRDIVAARFDKARRQTDLQISETIDSNNIYSNKAVALAQVPDLQSQTSAEEGAAPICVRRGTSLDCN